MYNWFVPHATHMRRQCNKSVGQISSVVSNDASCWVNHREVHRFEHCHVGGIGRAPTKQFRYCQSRQTHLTTMVPPVRNTPPTPIMPAAEWYSGRHVYKRTPGFM
jgi:hypothetical protein